MLNHTGGGLTDLQSLITFCILGIVVAAMYYFACDDGDGFY